MAARKSSRVNRKCKTKYRIRNWREYERALRNRGDVNSDHAPVALGSHCKRHGQRRLSGAAFLGDDSKHVHA